MLFVPFRGANVSREYKSNNTTHAKADEFIVSGNPLYGEFTGNPLHEEYTENPLYEDCSIENPLALDEKYSENLLYEETFNL